MSATYDIGRHCIALKPVQIASGAGTNHRLLQLNSLKLSLAAHQDIYLSEALPTPSLCVIAGLSAVALPFLLPGPTHLVWAPSRSPMEESDPLIADMRGRERCNSPLSTCQYCDSILLSLACGSVCPHAAEKWRAGHCCAMC